jgi:hypothetical protein
MHADRPLLLLGLDSKLASGMGAIAVVSGILTIVVIGAAGTAYVRSAARTITDATWNRGGRVDPKHPGCC